MNYQAGRQWPLSQHKLVSTYSSRLVLPGSTRWRCIASGTLVVRHPPGKGKKMKYFKRTGRILVMFTCLLVSSAGMSAAPDIAAKPITLEFQETPLTVILQALADHQQMNLDSSADDRPKPAKSPSAAS